MMNMIGGRKFVLAVLAIGIGSWVQIAGANGVSESFAALLIGIVAAFGASNAFVTTKMGPQPAEPAVQAEPPPAPEPEEPASEPSQNDQLIDVLQRMTGRLDQLESALLSMGDAVGKATKLAQAASLIQGRRQE